MKKFFAIFLIFFLLFGVCFPAVAAETSDILPPTLDSTSDSYIVNIRDYLTNGRIYYDAYMYNSDDWYIYCETGTSLVRLMSFTDNPSPVYKKEILSTDYNPNNNNNGWGTLESTYINDGQSNNGGNFYYVQVSGTVFTSNRDIPYAVLNKTTNSLDYNGEFFFTLTPPLVVETTKALTLFQSQTIQTILILVLCGVGCLALLISLPILRKVLLRFLNK